MKREQVAVVASRQLGLITWEQLVEIGLTRHEIEGAVRRKEWRRLEPTVYCSNMADPDPRVQLLAAALGVGADTVVSHSTAAALHGIPGFNLSGRAAHLTVPLGVRVRRTRTTVHATRSLEPHHVTVADSIPVTTVARTLFDLGRICRPKRVERAVDDALAAGIVTVVALETVLEDLAGPGRAGTAAMRAILTDRGDGYVAPRSRLERRFLEIVEQYGLPEPRREVDVSGADGWIGRVEFVYDEGVLVECDGRRWHSALTDIEHDLNRDNAFGANGYIVLRFRYKVLRDHPELVARQVRAALAQAAGRKSAAS